MPWYDVLVNHLSCACKALGGVPPPVLSASCIQVPGVHEHQIKRHITVVQVLCKGVDGCQAGHVQRLLAAVQPRGSDWVISRNCIGVGLQLLEDALHSVAPVLAVPQGQGDMCTLGRQAVRQRLNQRSWSVADKQHVLSREHHGCGVFCCYGWADTVLVRLPWAETVLGFLLL